MLKLEHLNSEGFSLVEVIAVLAILVIVSALIISRNTTSSANLITQTEVLRNHLRDAQIKAMAGTDVTDIFGIKWDTAFYWMFQGNNPDSNIVRLFDDEQYNVNHDNKLSLAEKKVSITAPFNTVFFDKRGIPYRAYIDPANNTPFAEDLLITITPNGASSPSKTLTITQHTGFIP